MTTPRLAGGNGNMTGRERFNYGFVILRTIRASAMSYMTC